MLTEPGVAGGETNLPIGLVLTKPGVAGVGANLPVEPSQPSPFNVYAPFNFSNAAGPQPSQLPPSNLAPFKFSGAAGSPGLPGQTNLPVKPSQLPPSNLYAPFRFSNAAGQPGTSDDNDDVLQ